MSVDTLNVLVAAVGGFLLGHAVVSRADTRRLNWLLAKGWKDGKGRWATWTVAGVDDVRACEAFNGRADIDAAMAAEAAHDGH